MAAKTTFCIYLVKRLIVSLRCAVNIIFSTFSLNFKCQICVQKEVIHNFKNHILVTWPTYRFSKEKSYNFHFNKNQVTWLLSANGQKTIDQPCFQARPPSCYPGPNARDFSCAILRFLSSLCSDPSAKDVSPHGGKPLYPQ